MREANKLFEVVVFTASHQCYADAVLDFLDPTRELVQHRLYREDCLLVNDVHVKDLRVLGDRNLDDIVIVDNAVHSFGYQLDNGIPLMSWHNDYADSQLLHLAEYLKVMHRYADVRDLNRATFDLQRFYTEYRAMAK